MSKDHQGPQKASIAESFAILLGSEFVRSTPVPFVFSGGYQRMGPRVLRVVVMMLSDRTSKALRAAGWFPGRRVDLTSRFKEWASVGMTFSGVVPGFLAEFYDLHLKVKLADGRDWHVDFEPMKAFDDYLDVVLDEEHRADLREMNDLIKGTVSIIGQTDALLLLMCDKGLTFGLPPEQVYWCRIGYNVEDSLERLCGSDGYFQWEPFGV